MPASGRGVVVAHVPRADDHASEHERRTLLAFAHQLAALKGMQPAGFHDPSVQHPGPVYFVPASTLNAAEAAALGIRGPDDLFGGVVPHDFVGTKAISHPLVEPQAASIVGWNQEFAGQVGDAVLAGFSTFTHADARRAGLQLLAHGPVRIKPVRATGGQGQVVVRDAQALDDALAGLDEQETRGHGLAVEEDLEEGRTFSVGQVQVGDLTASYYGFQRLTLNNAGEEVFGGSHLDVVRGGFADLLARPLPPEIRRAVEQAQRYHAAVRACFPGFYASRSNYDILLGRDGRGRWRSGVLEQSWRVGGATGPELAALEVFRREPQRSHVRASCIEAFGESPAPPPGATVYFRGADPQVGLLTKYTVLEPDADPR